MGYKIPDAKKDIKEAIVDYMEESCCASIVARGQMMEELCDIVDEHFEKLEH